jgi:hypothetical protein
MADWIPVSDAAAESGYNVEYIRSLMRRGRVTGKKIVTVWMVNRKSWQAYLASIGKRGNKRGPKMKGA